MRCFKIVFLLSFVIQNFPMCAYDFSCNISDIMDILPAKK